VHSRNTSSCKSANQHLNERRYHLEPNFKPSQLTSFFSGKIPSYTLRFSQNNRARPSKISRTMHVLELSIHDLILRMQLLQGLNASSCVQYAQYTACCHRRRPNPLLGFIPMRSPTSNGPSASHCRYGRSTVWSRVTSSLPHLQACRVCINLYCRAIRMKYSTRQLHRIDRGRGCGLRFGMRVR
jgi:hypothetical protein